MMLYVRYHPELAGPDYAEKYFRRQLPIYAMVNGSYLVGMALAPVAPGISYGIYGAVVISLIVFLTKWHMRVLDRQGGN